MGRLVCKYMGITRADIKKELEKSSVLWSQHELRLLDNSETQQN
jgi:hypothetical protein